MRIYWNTKRNYWKIDFGIWWKQFRFGVWWDSDYGNTEVCIDFAFWCIDIWKNKRAK